MDAETRHQLKQNELAAALMRLRTMDQRTTRIIVIIAVAIVLVAAWRVTGWVSQRSAEQAWRALAAVDVGGSVPVAELPAAIAELRSAANDSHDAVALSARLRLAAALLRQADNDPQVAEANTAEARQIATDLVGQSDLPVTVTGPAYYLLGRIHENAREWDAARQVYETLTESRFAGSPFQRIAGEKLTTLDELSKVRVELQPGLPPAPPNPELVGPPATVAPTSVFPATPAGPAEPVTPPADETPAPDEAAPADVDAPQSPDAPDAPETPETPDAPQ